MKRDKIRDVISCCACSCEMGKISSSHNISIKNLKAKKLGRKKFRHECQPRGWSRSGFHRMPMHLMQDRNAETDV